MTALNKHAELRKELSNPAIGSKDHLRKLALSLLDEVEIATDSCNGWQRKYAEADERLRAAEGGFAPLTVERLIREKEDLEKRIAELERANAAQDDHINQQQDRIDTLEKRNADLGKYAGQLEASHSMLREGMAAIHNTIRASGSLTPLASIMNGAKRAYEESAISELESHAVTVNMPDDSVDSAVSSRNQPGLVVAVHIEAGDFVKVKDHIFEVEETDFDDHDVTLWFVGGNTLKCAAGCLVEVVSAPTASIVIEGNEHDSFN
jgi:multidrug efflux pump subunit AcrA (membrane-fusion protein)